MTPRAALAAVMLALALVVPAVAGPFHEIPSNHWVYDAFTDLAAQGLIEGYPVGTFRGDRPMTRYEAAVIVARVLARMDAVRLQALPSYLSAVRRLLAEFHSELDLLGVNVAGVELEMAKLRAKTGDRVLVERSDAHASLRIPIETGASSALMGLRLIGAKELTLYNAGIGTHTLALSDALVGSSELSYTHAARRRGRWQIVLWVASDGPHEDDRAGADDRVTAIVSALPSAEPGLSFAVHEDVDRGDDALSPDWVLASGAVGLTLAQFAEPASPAPPALSRSPENESRVRSDVPASFGEGGSEPLPEVSANLGERAQPLADWTTWSAIPSLAAPATAGAAAWRIGGYVDLPRVGIQNWSMSLQFAHGGATSIVAPAPATASYPPYTTGAAGTRAAWDTHGWLARLNLSFTPRTTGSVLYEGGQILATGQSYAGWGFHMAHRMAPNATLTLQYQRTRCGTAGGVPCPGFIAAGDIDRVYRAELLYSW
jgi:hypothetical protein